MILVPRGWNKTTVSHFIVGYLNLLTSKLWVIYWLPQYHLRLVCLLQRAKDSRICKKVQDLACLQTTFISEVLLRAYSIHIGGSRRFWTHTLVTVPSTTPCIQLCPCQAHAYSPFLPISLLHYFSHKGRNGLKIPVSSLSRDLKTLTKTLWVLQIHQNGSVSQG